MPSVVCCFGETMQGHEHIPVACCLTFSSELGDKEPAKIQRETDCDFVAQPGHRFRTAK